MLNKSFISILLTGLCCCGLVSLAEDNTAKSSASVKNDGKTNSCPASVSKGLSRSVFRRMEQDARMVFIVKNMTDKKIANVNVKFFTANAINLNLQIKEIGPEKAENIILNIPAEKIRADKYDLLCSVEVPGYAASNEKFEFRIVNRPNPEQLPVLMWGNVPRVGGSAKLAELGFNRVLYVLDSGIDFKYIYDNPNATRPFAEDRARAAEVISSIDDAMANGLDVGVKFSAIIAAGDDPENMRHNRDGSPQKAGKKKKNVCPLLPQVKEFCKRAAKLLMQEYGATPAFSFAVLNTEIRDYASPCFHDIDKEMYKKASGEDIPAIIKGKHVNYRKIPGFPVNRVVADNNPILKYYAWYWKHGDGWVDLNNLINEEIKANRKDFLTWFDPATRVAPQYGSGGKLDMIGQWTYTYPDPIRVGMGADELINMAGGSSRKQQVFQMIQTMWYKSQITPSVKKEETTDPFLLDHIGEMVFITPSPAHIKEGFWTAVSRPADMIGYHGLGSLLPGEIHIYKYTHSDTASALAKLHNEIIKPYGPMFKKLPDRKNDVAFLESFATQVFTGKGSFGLGVGPIEARWTACAYAGLQMDIIFEETIKDKGLDQYKVLVLSECEVLSKSIFDKIVAFQKRGGIIIADQNLVPDIIPDILIPITDVPKNDGKKFKAANLAVADEIRKKLSAKYRPYAESENKEVVLHVRQYGDDEYIFAVNDTREFGDYVGQYGIVMENGVPAETSICIKRTDVAVIDILAGKEVASVTDGNYTRFSASLGAGAGKIYMITKNKAASIKLNAPKTAEKGKKIVFEVTVNGQNGAPLPSLIPLEVSVTDPAFRSAEPSGYYCAVNGRASITLDIAENDRTGTWEFLVKDIATGLTHKLCFSVIK